MATVLAVVALTLTGCTSEKDPGPLKPSPQQPPTPEGGTPDPPAAVGATTSLTEWVAAPGAVENMLTTSGIRS
jgi:hypothetical protein